MVTALESDQLILSLLDISESLLGTGQDAPCGGRHAPVLL